MKVLHFNLGLISSCTCCVPLETVRDLCTFLSYMMNNFEWKATYIQVY